MKYRGVFCVRGAGWAGVLRGWNCAIGGTGLTDLARIGLGPWGWTGNKQGGGWELVMEDYDYRCYRYRHRYRTGHDRTGRYRMRKVGRDGGDWRHGNGITSMLSLAAFL